MNFRIAIKTTLPGLNGVLRKLTGPGLREMFHAAGVEVQKVTVEHITVLAASRHATAGKLGATPSNYFAQAAEKVSAASALSDGPSGVTLTISHPGFIRAFRNVTIVPREAKALAIPIHAISYGRKASELWDRMNLFIPKGKRIIAATIGGVVTPLYLLCGRVTQKQDRTLLPSDEQFHAAAVRGAKNYIRSARTKEGQS